MVASLRDWAAANRELISKRVVSGVRNLIDLVDRVNWREIGRTFQNVARAGTDLGRALSRFVGGPENLIIGSLAALAAAPFAGVMVGLAGTTLALGRLATVLLTTRAGRLGLIAGGIYKLATAWPESNSFGDFLDNLGEMSALDWVMIGAGVAGLAASMGDIVRLSGGAAKGIKKVTGAGRTAAAASAGVEVAAGAAAGASGGAATSGAVKAGGAGAIAALWSVARVLGPVAAAAGGLYALRNQQNSRVRDMGGGGYLREFAGVTPTDDVEKAMFRMAAQMLDAGMAAAEVRQELRAMVHTYRTADDETRKKFQAAAPKGDTVPSPMGINEEADKLRTALPEAGREAGQGLADGVSRGAADAEAALAQSSHAMSGTVGLLGGQFFNAGANVMRQLAAGIRSGTPEVQAAAAAAAGTVADHFPQSPARRGPLRMLPQMGREIVAQLAGGMDPARAGLAAAGVAASIHAGLAGGTIGDLRAEIDAMRSAVSAPASRGAPGTGRLEISLRGAPNGASMSYSEKGRPLFDDVGLDTGRSMPRGRG